MHRGATYGVEPTSLIWTRQLDPQEHPKPVIQQEPKQAEKVKQRILSKLNKKSTQENTQKYKDNKNHALVHWSGETWETFYNAQKNRTHDLYI